MIEIEKGVPMPNIMGSTWGIWRKQFSKMEIGDSFVVEHRQLHNTLYVAAKRSGIRITIREIGDDKYRVWRIE